jgi:hypothetical protein
MLKNIKTVIELSQSFTGYKSSKKEEYIKNVNKNNILNADSKIRVKSNILKEMEEKVEIKIVGA